MIKNLISIFTAICLMAMTMISVSAELYPPAEDWGNSYDWNQYSDIYFVSDYSGGRVEIQISKGDIVTNSTICDVMYNELSNGYWCYQCCDYIDSDGQMQTERNQIGGNWTIGFYPEAFQVDTEFFDVSGSEYIAIKTGRTKADVRMQMDDWTPDGRVTFIGYALVDVVIV